jgi:hypothetical protein
MWITVALAGIALGAFSLFLEHRKEMAAVRGDTGDLADRLDAADRERARLQQRIEALEAIVTTETYDALRADPAEARARLDAGLLDPLPEPPEQEQAPQRSRTRSR